MSSVYSRDIAILKQIGSYYKLTQMNYVREKGFELDSYIQKNTVNTEKLNNNITVPLSLKSRKYLAKYLRKQIYISDYVFVTTSGKPISHTTLTQLFKKLKKRADIPRLHAHLLRHTFATKYLENGGDMFSLQQILGHTTLEMVKKYVHLNDGLKVRRFSEFSPLDNIK